MQISRHSAINLCQLEKGDRQYAGCGLDISYAVVDSPVGDCFIANSAAGLVYLGFAGHKQVPGLLQMLSVVWPQAQWHEDKKQIRKIAQSIFAHKDSPAITLLVKGTPFQVSVWKALLEIPSGTTCSYADIAGQVQRQQAFRAVGSAVGKNPVSYLIPCHRVLPQSGGVGNYLWGSDCKQKLLAMERASIEK